MGEKTRNVSARAAESGYVYKGAPVIARWMSVDPLAEKYDPIQGSLQRVEIIAAFSDICIRAA